jgi:HEAT repeat protein
VSLVARLASAALADRLAAMGDLVARGSASPEELAALAGCLDAEPKLVPRRAAETFAALAAGGVAVGDVLRAGLAGPRARGRWGAAYALARVGPPPPEVLPVLLDALGEDDGDVRWAAADILVRLPDSEAVATAVRRLAAEGNPAQRKMALYCLRDRDARGPAVEAVVLAGLDDPTAGVRLAAMASLARLAADRARAADRLAAALDDADAGVRRAAAAALGTLGAPTPVALAALRRAAEAPDPSLRRAAGRALQRLEAP